MEIHEYFTHVDWLVVFGYLALTTWVGHAMRGKQGTIQDFFLGPRITSDSFIYTCAGLWGSNVQA